MSTASHQPCLGSPTQTVAAPSTPGEQEQIMALADTMVLGYGLHPAEITRIR
ncbi:hypothetical protein ACFWZS_08205 [[Kitasatospora] papulosa]|uniref:hypothetical protein n=1 Tax=[Kitasatospora] papulosa TaxID=1464011 RepID=UPI001685EFDE|nr:hypothetical protein [Streptomyces pratensis]